MEFVVPQLVEAGAWVQWSDPNLGGANWRGLRDPRLSDAVVIHHSVTNPKGNLAQELAELWQIHKANGWGGIGYNFVISTEEVGGLAKVAQIGDLASIRAHTPNTLGAFGMKAGYGNFYLIGICFIGQLHINNPTPAQLRSAHLLVAELLFNEDDRLPLLGEWWDMHPHKRFDPTACSGKFDEFQKANIENPPAIEMPKPPSTGWNGTMDSLIKIDMLFRMKRGIPMFDLKTGLEITGSGNVIHVTRRTGVGEVNIGNVGHTMYLPIDRVNNGELFGFKEKDLYDNMELVKDPATDTPVTTTTTTTTTIMPEPTLEQKKARAFDQIKSIIEGVK